MAINAKVYYDDDADISLLDGKTIGVIGYGSQGHAHSLNLKDSGCEVMVGLYQGSKSWEKAEQAGLRVAEVAEVGKEADIMMMTIPDERQGGVFADHIAPNLKSGQTPHVRPRLQHPLQGSSTATLRGRQYDSPQGPRPPTP